MTTIEAPRVAGRERARHDVAQLGLAADTTLVVQFPSRSSATPSYLDELIAAVCSERKAHLVLKALSERAAAIARESADRMGVADLVRIEP